MAEFIVSLLKALPSLGLVIGLFCLGLVTTKNPFRLFKAKKPEGMTHG